MALKLVNQAGNALGQFDGYDFELTSFKGGEVVTFKSYPVGGSDLAAADVFDGYQDFQAQETRTVVTKQVTCLTRPLMLADDGVAGYGTLFGSVVGGTAGAVAGGVVLGPHTATGSGKITCWHLPGVYAVSLDACDTAAATGLQPTNLTLNAGKALSYEPGTGLLTPAGSPAAGGNLTVVGNFIEFQSSGSLVTTPSRLVSSLSTRSFSYAVFYFNPPANVSLGDCPIL